MRSFDFAAPLAALVLLMALMFVPAEQPAPDAGPPDVAQVSTETPPALDAADAESPTLALRQATEAPAAETQNVAGSAAGASASSVCVQTPAPGETLLRATRPLPSPAYRASIGSKRIDFERGRASLYDRIEPRAAELMAPRLDHDATRRLLLRLA